MSAAAPTAIADSPDSVRLSWDVLIVNGGTEDASLSAVSCTLALDGVSWNADAEPEEHTLAPGASTSASVVFSLPMPEPIAPESLSSDESPDPEAALADWSAAMSMEAIEYGDPRTLRSEASGSFPRIGKPWFRVVSITINQADLINTRLFLKLSVTNPNVFPVTLSAFSYELYGERRYWASGSLARANLILPLSSQEITLELEMNFTQMNRQVLDQVIKLEKVAYRLKGEVLVDMELEFIPPFALPFDMSESVTVAR